MSKIQKTEEVNVSGTTEDLTNTPTAGAEAPVVDTPKVEDADEFTPVGELPKADEVVPTAPETPEVTVPVVNEFTTASVTPKVEKPKTDKTAAKVPTAPKAGKSDLVKIKFKIDVGYKAKKHSAGDEAEFTETELEDFMPTWYTVL